MKKKKTILVISLLLIIILGIGIFFLTKDKSKYLSIKLNGKSEIVVEYGDKYKDEGAIAKYKKEDLTKDIKVSNNVNYDKLGKYVYTYEIKYNKMKKSIKRNIVLKDTKSPEIKLNGDESINIYVGSEYQELGATASDNYDKELNDKIKIDGSVDTSKIGDYTITYTVKDSSGNEASVKREVKVIEKPKVVSTYSNNSNKSTTTSKGYKVVQTNGIYYINGILIANKTYDLPSNYNPGGLLDVFQNNFNKLQSDASSQGINLRIISGFRSYASQKSIYNNYVARDGQALADRYSARPGHSEHQSGLAADINSLDQDWEYTNEGKWLNNNCYKYGFIIRYPKGKESQTGYMFEPWHIRYVGTDLASKLYNNGNWISLEEYFGITSSY